MLLKLSQSLNVMYVLVSEYELLGDRPPWLKVRLQNYFCLQQGHYNY